MPGMKLGFVNNAVQRVASHKTVPAPQLEAVIAYGAPNKRAAAMKKVVLGSATLSQFKETHQLVLTVNDVGDKTVRCELIYAMRGKLKELARGRYGNVVLQRLIEKLPATQCKEIATDYKNDASDLARHQFANHVLQKLCTKEEAADIVMEAVSEEIGALAVHATAQHVIAALVRQGCAKVLSEFETLESLAELIEMQESAVLTALVCSTNDVVQRAAFQALVSSCAKLCEEGKQHFALIAAIEGTAEAELELWNKEILPNAHEFAKAKGIAAVVAALTRRLRGAARNKLVAQALTGFDDVVAAGVPPLRVARCPRGCVPGRQFAAAKGARHVDCLHRQTLDRCRRCRGCHPTLHGECSIPDRALPVR